MRLAARSLVLVMAGILAACQTAPTPAPTGIEGTPAPLVSASPTASRPIASQSPALPVTSAAKIQAAVEAGSIDEPTGILYRVYAIFGDGRLPAELRGVPEEDHSALKLAQEGLDTFPAAIRSDLLPYLVRPTDPASYWSVEPTTGGSGSSARLVTYRKPGTATPIQLGAPSCIGPWMHDRVGPFVPIMLWTQCTGGAAAAAQLLGEARADMNRLWIPETSLMGDPIGDQNVANDGYPDTPETGDGLIDIYLLSNFSPSGIPRSFAYGTALAVTTSTPPSAGPAGAETSSAYVVISPGLIGAALESALAHEFFHVLQFGHNLDGLLDCPIQQLQGCAPTAHEPHWFVEASAAWAEHYFVHRARALYPYPRFRAFQVTNRSLADTQDLNEYLSWTWPLFMQQEGGAAKPIGDAWRATEGKVGWRKVQAAIDRVLPFKDHFRDFGVRLWNQDLTPGDPIDPRFNSPNLDPAFPTDQPSDGRLQALNVDNLLDVGSAIAILEIESLATRYVRFEPSLAVHKLTFDFVALAPEVDIDALVKIAGQAWERRKLPADKVEWCLDNPADDVEEGILVFSDHDQDPRHLTRDWSVMAESSGCSEPLGTVTYTELRHGNFGSSTTQDARVNVVLQPKDPNDDPSGRGYSNDGSTYSVRTFDHSFQGTDATGCVAFADSAGNLGGPLQPDSVIGSLGQEDDGTWFLSLGIALPVHVETDYHLCALGFSHGTSETTLQIPPCDGKEAGGAATIGTRTFVFDCHFQGDSEAWSVTGTVVLRTPPPPP